MPGVLHAAALAVAFALVFHLPAPLRPGNVIPLDPRAGVFTSVIFPGFEDNDSAAVAAAIQPG